MGWKRFVIPAVAAFLALIGCSPTEEAESDAESSMTASSAVDALKQALTFHASFDDGPDAAFAKGDRRIYTAPSYDEQDKALPGIGNPDVEIVEGGRFGYALQFNKKNVHAIFYRGEDNVSFNEGNWTGSVSFWLNLNPDEDLEPGYCDPIQITDSAYNDSAVWVDFTRDDTPRHFRLGVFGDLKAWNPEELQPNDNPDFLNRLVVVSQHPSSEASGRKWWPPIPTLERERASRSCISTDSCKAHPKVLRRFSRGIRRRRHFALG